MQNMKTSMKNLREFRRAFFGKVQVLKGTKYFAFSEDYMFGSSSGKILLCHQNVQSWTKLQHLCLERNI